MPSFGSFCAVPGLAVPGAMRPGLPAAAQAPDPPGTLPQVTVVTILTAQVFSAEGLAGAAGLKIVNQGPAQIWAGGASVTAVPSAGIPLEAGAWMFLAGPAPDLWAVTQSGAATVIADLAETAAII